MISKSKKLVKTNQLKKHYSNLIPTGKLKNYKRNASNKNNNEPNKTNYG